MPVKSKAQYRYEQGVCHGSIKSTMSPKQACEAVKGQSPKGLPSRVKKGHK